MKTKINKITKYLFLSLFITFLSLYLSQNTGYFEYQNQKKTALTEKQIQKFEKDVKNGKEIDLQKYIEEGNPNYQNTISKAGLNISEASEKVIRKIINTSFKALSKIAG